MKIITLSDTHGRHEDLILPEADLILHSGDITYFSHNGMQRVADFMDWFQRQPAKHKIFIAGNHDLHLEKEEKFFRTVIPPGIIYLNDEMVTVDGVSIWGSPITPWFHDWAFNRRRGHEIQKHWDLIPSGIDILLTHGPAYGILDKSGSENIGCKDLLKTIERVKPLIHCFGHTHVDPGIKKIKETFFINSAVVNHKYLIVRKPIIVDFDLINKNVIHNH